MDIVLLNSRGSGLLQGSFVFFQQVKKMGLVAIALALCRGVGIAYIHYMVKYILISSL